MNENAKISNQLFQIYVNTLKNFPLELLHINFLNNCCYVLIWIFYIFVIFLCLLVPYLICKRSNVHDNHFQDPSLPLNKNKIHIQMNHFMEIVATRQILIKTPFHGSM